LLKKKKLKERSKEFAEEGKNAEKSRGISTYSNSKEKV